MGIEFDVRFGQDLCDVFSNELGLTCSFMGAGGRIVASSARERIGAIHAIAARIMQGEMDEYGVTAEEAKKSSGMREGVNLGIDVEGERLINFGLAGPLETVRPLARIVRFCVQNLVRTRLEEQKIIEALAKETGGVGAKMIEIAGDIEDVAGRVADQSRLLAELQQGVRAVSSGAGAIVAASTHARGEAAAAAAGATQGAAKVAESLGAIGALAAQVASGRTALLELQNALAGVVGVADGINRIAKQTNMLALNATIESARAGEHGRGFAVVAAEVKALSRQTGAAATEIRATLDTLQGAVGRMIAQGEQSAARAETLNADTAAISEVIEHLGASLAGIAGDVGGVNDSASGIDRGAADLIGEIDAAAAGLSQFQDRLQGARDRLGDLLQAGERLVVLTAQTGIETSETPFVGVVRVQAQEISALFEQAVDRGEITLEDLFDENYRPNPGSNPPQFVTRFCDFTDRVLQDRLEKVLASSDRVAFCAAVDRNGYLPTHNRKYSQPPGADPAWNAAHCRNRRKFDDPVGLAAARNTEPFIVQSYRRDMGGGKAALMLDAAAPIIVKGRHWGALRLGYA